MADMQQAVIRHAQNDMSALGPEPAPKAEQAAPKIGEGHLAAMLRLGLKELAQALKPLPDSNIGQLEEPGVFGNITPQIATDQMGYDGVLADSAHPCTIPESR